MRVECTREDRVFVITMRRADKRNAIDAQMTAALDSALNELDDDPELWAGILTGGLDAFSAGTDLAAGPGDPTERGGEYGVVRRKRKTPLIAAVEGVALGGGMEVALACDMIVAASDARFGLPEVKRGVIATCGALFRAARSLPVHIGKELLLTGEPIDAQTARGYGFVNRVVEPGQALEADRELAAKIVANAPISVSQTLQAVDRAVGCNDDIGWQATAEAIKTVMSAEDLGEGIAAFLAKRPPRWKGR